MDYIITSTALDMQFQKIKKKKLRNSHLVLVAEDVIVDIVLLGALWSENKGLHEPPHRLPVVRELAAHLVCDI